MAYLLNGRGSIPGREFRNVQIDSGLPQPTALHPMDKSQKTKAERDADYICI
jgi:hypothetical protein